MCRWLAYSGSSVRIEDAALQARALADRPEPPLAARRGDDERGRVRHRLVRHRRDARRLPQRRAGLERPQPARPCRAHLLAARVRAHPRLVRLADPADELPPVPPRSLALDAQRADPRLPRREARPRARRRPVALPVDRGLDRLGDVLLPGADARARGRPAGCRRARGRLHRAGRPQPRHRAPDPDDGGDDRRQHTSGAFRYSSERKSRSLFFSTRVDTLREQHPEVALLQELSDESRLIVSEPLGSLAGAWNEVPESSYGVVQEGQDELHPFTPRPPG